MLIDLLYGTTRSAKWAFTKLEMEYDENLLEDLERCSCCGRWFYSYEVTYGENYDTCAACDIELV